MLVEGRSDQAAVEALAARGGRDLHAERVAVVPMGGATNIGHFLRALGFPDGGVRLAGLCDQPQQGDFRRALQRWGRGGGAGRTGLERLGFFVCEADLEDELIRALGTDRVRQVLEAQGELGSFRTFTRQPFQRGRSPGAQLRRFIGTRSGRKLRYARVLAEALDPGRVPRPLASLLAYI